MIQETSRLSYKSLNLSCRQRAVLEALRESPSTIGELAVRLALTPNEISPRIAELREKGEVIYDGKRKSAVTGKLNMVWKRRTSDIDGNGQILMF